MKETEQTLLEKIKDDVALEWGFRLWKLIDYYQIDQANNADGSPENPYAADVIFEEVCERYATAKAQASCEATLKNASDNAKVLPGGPSFEVDKDSINDPKNITIV